MPTTTSSQFVSGPVEAVLRVEPVSLGAQRAELVVGSGPWLVDPVVGVSRAALGVALDDVTGFVVAAGSRPQKWPVSLGIRLDFLGDPPTDGTAMTAVGELVARDDTGATTRGFAADADGRVVALVTQRSHLVETDDAPESHGAGFDIPPGDAPLSELLGLVAAGPGVVEMPSSPLAANVMGNLHGGVLIYACEYAAVSAIGPAPDLRISSVDIVYLRPGDATQTTRFHTEIVHRGRSLSVVRVTAVGAAGKPGSVATVIVQRP